MKKAIKFLNMLEDNTCAIILVYMTITAFINVIARYIFLASLPWVEELNKVGLVIMTYCGAAVALKRGSHLGLTIITDLLPRKVQQVVFILGCLAGIFFCYFGIRYGYAMVLKEYINDVRTQGMQWPEFLYAMWLPIGCLVLAIRFVQKIYYTICNMVKKEVEE